MSSRNGQRNSSTGKIARLFLWTAIIAIVFSVGLIMGQRILIEDGLPPVVSPGGNTPALSATTEDPVDIDRGDDRRSDLFSFYDALTGSDVEEAAATGERGADEDRDVTGDESPAGVDPEQPPEDIAGGAQGDERSGDAARFTLQIASHPTMERARTEMDRLRTMELEPELIADEGTGGEELYRVRVGKFPSEDDARTFMRRLEADHDLRAFVTSL